jgi:hypothetical protein
MIRESLFYKILSAIHYIFFTSLLCFGIIYLSLGLLMLPALGAVFKIGKDFIYKKLDITDSIIRTYFRYFKSSLPLVKFLPLSIIMLVDIAGMLAAAKSQNMVWGILCLSAVACMLVYALYAAGYHTYVDDAVNPVEVLLAMFLKPYFLMPVFVIMVLCVFFFSLLFVILSLLLGAFFLFAVEVTIFIQMLLFKKASRELEEDEFEYLFQKRSK